MPGQLNVSRRVLVAAAAVAAAAGTAIALLPLRVGGRPAAAERTATVARGDIVLTVGGVGRVVAAGASGPLAVPAASTVTAAQPTTAPAGAVFATAPGHLARFLVSAGAHVTVGRALAVIDDGGTAAAALDQAQRDLATARVELRQKQTSDPARGLPATPEELRAATLAARVAGDKARRIAHPPPADVTAARLDLARARGDLETLLRTPTPAAVAAAQAAVDAATQKVAQTSSPASVDVGAAKAELAKAQADLDALRAPTTTAVQAAQLAVTLAQQKLAELPGGSAASAVTSAQLDLKKAQADLETLQGAPRAAALASARAAVDLASQRLAQVTGPPTAAALATAQAELGKTKADLEALRRAAGAQALAAARTAVRLGDERLRQLLRPGAAALDAGRADAAKAIADLTALQHRGGPAGPLDIQLARLKVDAAAAKVSAAELQVRRLTVHAPRTGTITALLTAPGAPTDPSTPIASVVDLAHLAVTVDLSEFDVARVRRGDRAALSVDALGGKELPGRVEFVALTGTDSGGVVTFPVRVALEHPGAVKPGMNVSVKIRVAERRGVVLVPLDAVNGRTVTLAGGGARAVRLGLADNKRVEIRSGLRPGERVLVGG